MPKNSETGSLDQYLKDIGAPAVGQTKMPEQQTQEMESGGPSASGDFAKGVGQGLLGYVEAPAYYAERAVRTVAPSFRLNPFGLRDWAKDFRDRVESSPAGIAGEVAGTVAPALIPVGGWAAGAARTALGAEDAMRIARLLETSRLAQGIRTAARPLEKAGEAIGPVGRGAVAGVMSRPATSEEELIEQAGLGAAGGAIGRAFAPVPRTVPKFVGAGERATARDYEPASGTFTRMRNPEFKGREPSLAEIEGGGRMPPHPLARAAARGAGHVIGGMIHPPFHGGSYAVRHALADWFSHMVRQGYNWRQLQDIVNQFAKKYARGPYPLAGAGAGGFTELTPEGMVGGIEDETSIYGGGEPTSRSVEEPGPEER